MAHNLQSHVVVVKQTMLTQVLLRRCAHICSVAVARLYAQPEPGDPAGVREGSEPFPSNTDNKQVHKFAQNIMLSYHHTDSAH